MGTSELLDVTIDTMINVRCLDIAEYSRGWDLYRSGVSSEESLPFRDAPSDVENLPPAVAFHWLPNSLLVGCFRNFWMIGIARIDRRSPIMLAHKATLELVYLLPEHRGRGYGQAFLKGIMREAREKGIERLQLHVDVSELAEIKKFHAAGFETCGTETCAKKANGRCIDQQILEVDLMTR